MLMYIYAIFHITVINILLSLFQINPDSWHERWEIEKKKKILAEPPRSCVALKKTQTLSFTLLRNGDKNQIHTFFVGFKHTVLCEITL